MLCGNLLCVGVVCGCECVGVNFLAAKREEELEEEGISDDQEWSKASGNGGTLHLCSRGNRKERKEECNI